MKPVLLLLLALSCCAAAEVRDGLVTIRKFTISAPKDGQYVPWQPGEDGSQWYAGEIIAIKQHHFSRSYFSDVLEENLRAPIAGEIKVEKDRIVFTNASFEDRTRVAGVADGVSVLLTLRGYEAWKKTKKVSELDILFREDLSVKIVEKPLPNL